MYPYVASGQWLHDALPGSTNYHALAGGTFPSMSGDTVCTGDVALLLAAAHLRTTGLVCIFPISPFRYPRNMDNVANPRQTGWRDPEAIAERPWLAL